MSHATPTVSTALRRHVASLLETALRARGEPGRELLATLYDPQQPLPDWVRDALLEAVATQPPEPSDLSDDTLAPDLAGFERTFVLGDVHGRWDAVEPLLRSAGLVDERGHWCAPAGTCLVQVGDLLDADLTARFDPRSDPDGARLVEAFRDTLDAVLDALAPGTPTRELAHALVAGTVAQASLWHQRHALVGACLVERTLGAMRRLEQEAAAAGSCVVILMGNHELDLLSGRLWWYEPQKRFWLALHGLDAAVLDRAAGDPAVLAAAHPTLAWLAARPLAARLERRFLVMHGGPTREATEALATLELAPGDFAALRDWLARCAAQDGFCGAFFAEGRSVFSPVRGGGTGDFVGELELLLPWLEAAGADWLVVGHSPFLGFARDTWLDPEQAAVAERLAAIERLGTHRNVLAVDTNLKRADTCSLLELRPARGRLEVLEADGRRHSLLDQDESLDAPHGALGALRAARALRDGLDARRGPELVDLVEPGLDAELFDEALRQLDALGPGQEPLRAAVIGLLRAFPTDTTRLRALLRRRAQGELAAGEALVVWFAALQQRAQVLAARLEPSAGAWRLLLDTRRTTVDGVRFRLVEAVVEALWQRVRAQALPELPAVAAELVADAGRPALRLSTFAFGSAIPASEVLSPAPADYASSWRTLERFAARCLARAPATVAPRRRAATDTPAASGVIPAAPPPRPRETMPRLPRAAVDALVALNRAGLARCAGLESDALAPHAEVRGAELDDGPCALRPGWLELAGPWPRLRAALTPRGELVLADTAFVDPGALWSALCLDERGEVLRSVAQRDLLREALECDDQGRVWLYSQAREPVAARLSSGEVEGLIAGRRSREAPWRSGCYLFTAPQRDAARHFADGNPIALSFAVPADVLDAWLEARLLQLNLMIADFGATLDTTARWGAPDVTVEAVAIGADAVRALWSWRVRT